MKKVLKSLIAAAVMTAVLAFSAGTVLAAVPMVTTGSDVNLRSAAAFGDNVITRLPAGSKVSCLSTEGTWALVETNGRKGYVSTDFLAPDTAAAAVQAAGGADAAAAAAAQAAQAAAAQAAAVQAAVQPAAAGGHVVCIDPGHQRRGDSTPEPIGPGSGTMKARVTGGTHGTTTGVYEYQLALTISQLLKNELIRRGYTVVMTRESHDVNISNMERAQFAAQAGAEITVRIHANGADSAAVSGALALTPSAANPYVAALSGQSGRLSADILNAYCAATGMRNRGVQANDSMTGINWCTMPVTILEMGYMTNPADDLNMENAASQTQMAAGIANGLDAYFRGE